MSTFRLGVRHALDANPGTLPAPLRWLLGLIGVAAVFAATFVVGHQTRPAPSAAATTPAPLAATLGPRVPAGLTSAPAIAQLPVVVRRARPRTSTPAVSTPVVSTPVVSAPVVPVAPAPTPSKAPSFSNGGSGSSGGSGSGGGGGSSFSSSG